MKFAKNLFCAYVGSAIFLIAFVAPFFDFYCRRPWNDFVPTVISFIAAIAIGVVAVSAISRLSGVILPRGTFYKRNLLLATGLLFAIQLVIVYGCIFSTGWDVNILRSAFYNPVAVQQYFSNYPNQLFLAGVYICIYKFTSFFGLSQAGYPVMVVLSCASVTVAIYFISRVAEEVYGALFGYLSFGVATFLVGLSPWILVPYSDTLAMPFVAAIFFAYTCIKRLPFKWFLIVSCALLGYALKPTAIFALLAILFMQCRDIVCQYLLRKKPDVCQMNAPQDGRSRHSLLCCALAIIVAFIFQMGIVSMFKSYAPDVDDEAAFGPAHYLMMGFNIERGGGWSGDDIAFSQSFKMKTERNQANFQRFRERISEAGPGGIASLLLKKTLSNYADGTFTWEGEGHFYISCIGRIPTLMAIYGISPDEVEGVNYGNNFFSLPVHVLWLFLLLGICLLILQKKSIHTETVMCLALFLLSGFLLLFEPRARYLILYAPCFVFLGLAGWRALLRRFFG